MTGWRRVVRAGDLTFQIGAGAAHGARVEELRAAGARVVAVEADPRRAQELRVRFGGSAGGAGSVVVVDMGVANRAARLPASAAGASIEITTLDQLMTAFGVPRYCRVDVGGDPESILAGIAAPPGAAPPIPLLSFEFKATRLDSVRRATDRLAALGYRQLNWTRAPADHPASPALLVSPVWLDARALQAQIARAADGAGGAELRGEVFASTPDVAAAMSPAVGERFAVSILRQPGNIHSECFRELAETVHCALHELGHDCVLSDDIATPGRRNIVFGSNLIANLDAPVGFAPGSILYNLEQIYEGSPWLTAGLLAAFRAHTVWDYSPANIAALARLGVAARHVPVGYVPALTRIPAAAAQDIDVLFIGSIAERRLAILQELERRGARVVAIYGRYGAERDALIARAKLVLNIHFHAAKVFEIVRVSYLLANRCFVVSETGSDAATEAGLAGGVVFAPHERLVETCLAYLADATARAQVAARGFAIMSSQREAEFLRPVVGAAC